jgi:hypothetical protein
MVKCDVISKFDCYGFVVACLEQDYKRMKGLEIVAERAVDGIVVSRHPTQALEIPAIKP